MAESQWRNELIDWEKQEIDSQEKPIRDFVKKLLGRIVFLHFLQKKGWMGCPADSNDWLDGEKRFMQLLFEEFNEKDDFHSKCLTKLFFETLNTKRPNDKFHIDGLVGKLNGSKVPYLNGGLFEPEKNKVTLQVDFPAIYFADLLEFFEQYNFTIDENSPDDHEVGIDPEMLGHIFENLLEENREKGAFYTPKEIVQYMCQESLIQYLSNSFSEQTDVEDFIRRHIVSEHLSQRDNAVKLNELLDNIKVCDPAIGSGAFPIGMLQEIFDAKRFIYPHLKTNKPFDPAGTKKNIIQNSIYGVDIEKGAVDIAQLRFWLALVVEEVNPHPLPNLDYKIMQGNSLLEKYEGIDLSQIAATKGERIYEPEKDLFGNIKPDQMKITFSKSNTSRKIKALIKEFFTIEDAERKREIRNKINLLVEGHILFNIDLREQQLHRFILEAGNPDNLTKNARKKYDGYLTDLDKLQETKENLLKIQETDERPYFLWHLFFMDVFEQGGFDVIIGNPPYIQLQKITNDSNLLEEVGYKTFTRTGDIYGLFYEKGINLLSEKGHLVYITSNKWMRAAYGKSLRNFFMDLNPKLLLDLGAGVFKSATVDTNILILQNCLKESNVSGSIVENSKDLINLKNEFLVPVEVGIDDPWVVLSSLDFRIKSLIEKNEPLLKNWSISINRGITSGLNEAFEIEEEQYHELVKANPKNESVLKPVLRGRDISRYSTDWSFNYLIYIPWHFPLHDESSIRGASSEAEKAFKMQYPEIFAHLHSFKDQLLNRNKVETGIRYEWYALQRFGSQFFEDFEKEKIVYKEMVQESAFCYDPLGKYFCFDTARIITGSNLKYLTIVLNSRLFFYAVKLFYGGGGLGDTGIRMKHTFFQNCPVPLLDNYEKFNCLLPYLVLLFDPKEYPIIENENQQKLTSVFEDVANMMVFELYFEEEMKSKGLDVLQFINEITFPDISKMTQEDKKATIQKVYYELQQKDNPIRNRILVSESRSEIIRRINEVTGK